MTLKQAVAAQPAWTFYWVKALGLFAFVLPLTLIFWKQSQIAGILTVTASIAGHIGLVKIYDRMGYVKLLGLPHIIFWTPLSAYLLIQILKPDMPIEPKAIMIIVLVVILISLIFDLVDLIRYISGNRMPLEGKRPTAPPVPSN